MGKHDPLDERSAALLSNIQAIRRRARAHPEKGAVTAGYAGNREAIVKLLNEALATEIVCVLRYKRHYYTARGPDAKDAMQEFAEHAADELDHADRIAARIAQLGDKPDFDPAGLLDRSHAEYVPGSTLAEMLREDLVAERIAIDSYREMIAYVGDSDPATRALLEEILATEEGHAEDLASLLDAGQAIGPRDPDGAHDGRNPGR